MNTDPVPTDPLPTDPVPTDPVPTDPVSPAAVGLAAWRLPVEGAEAAVRYAARLGADGVQLDLGGPRRGPRADFRGTAEAARQASAETGVVLLAMTANTLNDIGLTAPRHTADGTRVRTTLVRLLDAAGAYGVPLIFVPSFRRSAIETPQDLRDTARVLAWAATEAAARGLVLASENALTARDAAALVEAVANPGFRLLLDPLNLALAGRDPVRWAAELGPHLADQLHLKDGRPDTAASLALGTGEARLDDVLAAVAAHGPAPRALVLENDHRDGDTARALRDLAWARSRSGAPAPGPGAAPDPAPTHPNEATP
ncbi:sugar phosphate isomerase/epimerase family protein [Streptomyces sp. CRN 30]|uniref:sugar phosphate isomerase/epimerase family protein n=1 Tax=Streptomyces sp. CRN 30 TaxID=3075613 RepID=UPI002A82D47B|nr:TIM barrel protein [Streptomyces sp. CRN 30]